VREGRDRGKCFGRPSRRVAEKAEILITSLPNVGAFKQVMAEQAGIRPAARPRPWIKGGPALD
jgi:3-hydroxyisobutyrate dehydrogenase-like beta-hydroxyacid dehydrogenase